MDYSSTVNERLERRPATVREAKALAHPLRLRILRLCFERELTNKQLADRLDRDPGTVLYHVRQLLDAGMLEPVSVRAGDSGALEKPYRATGGTWWLDGPLNGFDANTRFAPIAAFQEELQEAGPKSVEWYERFVLHLSKEQAAELDNRLLEILDDYMRTDHERRDQPMVSGIVILHRPPD
jgi:DNA-binding transcriptional ArsR family regulator